MITSLEAALFAGVILATICVAIAYHLGREQGHTLGFRSGVFSVTELTVNREAKSAREKLATPGDAGNKKPARHMPAGGSTP
jgi:hypothetical protein